MYVWEYRYNAVPLQAWTVPEGSRKLRFPDFVTMAQDGDRLSALRTRRLYPQEILLVLIFLLEAELHGTIRTVHTTYTAALKTTTHPKTRFRKPYAATQHLMLLMMGVCTRNM